MSIECKEYNFILFDLDGTITDSKPGIVNSILYALESFDIYEEDIDKLEFFIGPPLVASFKGMYGFDDDKAALAVEKYREYYRDKGIYENTLYNGIDYVIKNLYDNSKRLIVATSKPTIFAKEVLQHHNLSQYFEEIIGSNLDGTRANKDEVIDHILGSVYPVNRDQIIMIGDRKYDIDGARQHGIDSIGVLYGYASTEEIKTCRPTYIVEDPQGLLPILIG